MSEVTQLLTAIQDGDLKSADQLLPLVYAELRRLAKSKLAQEAPGQTIQATELVHEAYLRLIGSAAKQRNWDGRRHFFGAAAEAMRRILIERARRKGRVKHGENAEHVSLAAIELPCLLPDDQLLLVHDALEELARVDPLAAELVKLRFFVG